MGEQTEQKEIVINANYTIFVLLLTLLSMANSILLLSSPDPATRQVVQIIDDVICIFLMLDFSISLLRSNYKRRYLFDYYGWLDFIGSLPLPLVRLARLVRLVLVNRQLQRTDFALMGRIVVERRAQSTLFTALFVAVLVFESAAIAVLRAEKNAPGANIFNGSDALWWSAVTVATVGYGDRYPVTDNGRIVGLFLMTAGVGMFSVITSFLADWFRRPRSPARPLRIALRPAPEDNLQTSPRSQLQELQQLLDEREAAHQRDIDEIRARLEEIVSRLP